MSASVLRFTYGITGVQYKSFRKTKGGVVYCAEMLAQKISCPLFHRLYTNNDLKVLDWAKYRIDLCRLGI